MDQRADRPTHQRIRVITKDPARVNTGSKITTDGERHMGAVIESETFKEIYVNEKVEK